MNYTFLAAAITAIELCVSSCSGGSLIPHKLYRPHEVFIRSPADISELRTRHFKNLNKLSQKEGSLLFFSLATDPRKALILKRVKSVRKICLERSPDTYSKKIWHLLHQPFAKTMHSFESFSGFIPHLGSAQNLKNLKLALPLSRENSTFLRSLKTLRLKETFAVVYSLNKLSDPILPLLRRSTINTAKINFLRSQEDDIVASLLRLSKIPSLRTLDISLGTIEKQEQRVQEKAFEQLSAFAQRQLTTCNLRLEKVLSLQEGSHLESEFVSCLIKTLSQTSEFTLSSLIISLLEKETLKIFPYLHTLKNLTIDLAVQFISLFFTGNLQNSAQDFTKLPSFLNRCENLRELTLPVTGIPPENFPDFIESFATCSFKNLRILKIQDPHILKKLLGNPTLTSLEQLEASLVLLDNPLLSLNLSKAFLHKKFSNLKTFMWRGAIVWDEYLMQNTFWGKLKNLTYECPYPEYGLTFSQLEILGQKAEQLESLAVTLKIKHPISSQLLNQEIIQAIEVLGSSQASKNLRSILFSMRSKSASDFSVEKYFKGTFPRLNLARFYFFEFHGGGMIRQLFSRSGLCIENIEHTAQDKDRFRMPY